jgi:hypothetical protein
MICTGRVGAELARESLNSETSMVADAPHSRASSAPTGYGHLLQRINVTSNDRPFIVTSAIVRTLCGLTLSHSLIDEAHSMNNAKLSGLLLAGLLVVVAAPTFAASNVSGGAHMVLAATNPSAPSADEDNQGSEQGQPANDDTPNKNPGATTGSSANSPAGSDEGDDDDDSDSQ